ncbi:HNH endonuclease signature motif containing protein [Jatrophihabitans sp. GAS493]|uniref:HNH endonuclease signature motif containing protein n=1 Tax=Jatrophihabitans sp. GAS493 TaxID=1907575 RepID=UPI001560A92E|nr:HNH endonuclease signature motif containing protein [Jatrophihabitans sp. GAS493]
MDDDAREPLGGCESADGSAAASDNEADFTQYGIELGEPFCAESVAGLLDGESGSESASHLALTVLDVLAAPETFAKHFAISDPDPADLSLLSALDPRALTAAGRVDLLAALRRQSASVKAAITEGVAVVVERVTEDGLSLELGYECANAEISTALMISPRVAAFELSHATQLVTKLPATMNLLRRGVITDAHAAVLARETVGIDDRAVLAAVENSVLTRAPGQTAQLFSRSVKRAVLKHNHVTVEQQQRDVMAKRTVEHTPRPDGMAEIWALLPAEDAAAVIAAVNALAWHTSSDDPRTADQRRADSFTHVFIDALNTPGYVPTQHGRRPSIQVTVAMTTLMGVNDLPGQLEGHGPIPASVARRIAADPTGTWRRLITDPATGELMEYGRTRYTPPQDLTDFVITRDQICSFPTCNVPAIRTNLDHEVPFPQGPTNKVNLRCKCRRHHRLKHQTRWRVKTTEGDAGTTSEWTSPNGHTYSNQAPPLHDPDADTWGALDPESTYREGAGREWADPGGAGRQGVDREGVDREGVGREGVGRQRADPERADPEGADPDDDPAPF